MHVISSRYGLDDLQENPAQVFGSSAFKLQASRLSQPEKPRANVSLP
jgi:hypothetical protein